MDIIKKVQHFFSYWYLRYILATELYMVEPWERVVIHMLLSILFIAFYYFNYVIVISGINHLRGGTSSLESVS